MKKRNYRRPKKPMANPVKSDALTNKEKWEARNSKLDFWLKLLRPSWFLLSPIIEYIKDWFK